MFIRSGGGAVSGADRFTCLAGPLVFTMMHTHTYLPVRYCAGCMTGKKVRVFWPVDAQWYIADVRQYDGGTGEHLLRYPDGDTEWVRIGEDHTTNAQ